MSDPLDCALDLMRRLPPAATEMNLARLIQLVPALTEDLLTSVDQPLRITRCSKTAKDFLLCDYNRDGDSYRSPWSNEYQPALADGNKPSPKLQKLEASANEAFDTYRDLYYGGGVSSVYLWDLDDGFAGVVLIKKTISEGKETSSWDSIHVLEVTERGKSARYRVTSTIMLQILSDVGNKAPKIDLSGGLTRQSEQEAPFDTPVSHIFNIGRLVEDMEFKMRVTLEQIYFGKTKDVVNDLRSFKDLETVKVQNALQAQLAGRLTERRSVLEELLVSTNFSEDEITRLFKRFVKLDKDGSGCLERDEFLSIPQIASNPLAQRLLAVFDTDGSGDVDFKEFLIGLSAFSAKGKKEDKLRFAFKVYDMDRDGYVSNGELFLVLKMMVGNNLKDNQLQQIVDKTIMEADLDMDGKVSFDEFKKMVESTDIARQMTLEPDRI